jgi:hypothetical protein
MDDTMPVAAEEGIMERAERSGVFFIRRNGRAVHGDLVITEKEVFFVEADGTRHERSALVDGDVSLWGPEQGSLTPDLLKLREAAKMHGLPITFARRSFDRRQRR